MPPSTLPVMRNAFIFLLLSSIKLASRCFYRVRMDWVRGEPEEPWENIRIVAILNHTSLFEPIFAGAAPFRLLRGIAKHGVVPVADKTANRPWVGRFFRIVANQVVPITRERDDTWANVMERIEDPEAMLVILPEGRMKRPTGLDLHGEEMTIRGGIADILLAIPEGRLLLAYSGGLHHIHAPGDRLPRLFKTVRLRLELLEIADYRERMLARVGREGFKAAVIRDLTDRRDRCCPCDDDREVAG